MKRRTFCCLLHASDCVEEVDVVIERGVMWDEADPDKPFKAHYRLVSYPSTCKCRGYVPHADPPQEVLRAAYHAEEAEDA